jgi:K+-sensing histidine kinase KdpD
MENTLSQHDLFSTILASSVHDIKNNLSTLLESVKHLRKKSTLGEDADLQQLELEVIRIHQGLMQLLVLYKVDQHSFMLVVDEYAALDLLQEARLQQQSLLDLNHLELITECDQDLICYCDFQYTGQVLASVLNNALRHCRQRVLISAYEQDGYCVFSIEDDGAGYPTRLFMMNGQQALASDLKAHRTGLGLCFASIIANLHKNVQRQGWISLDNESRLGGARFRLMLP